MTMTDLTNEDAANVALVYISAEKKRGRIDDSTNEEKLNAIIATTLANRMKDGIYRESSGPIMQMASLVNMLIEALEAAGVLNRTNTELSARGLFEWHCHIEQELEQLAK